MRITVVGAVLIVGVVLVTAIVVLTLGATQSGNTKQNDVQ